MQRWLSVIIVLMLASVMFAGCTHLQTSDGAKSSTEQTSSLQNLSETNFVPYTATFEIYTNGTKRVFTDVKYHNQSETVFIESSNPSLLHVEKPEVIWDDFFKTLPMSLTTECLVTGTKQTFCSSENSQLRFYINDVETPDALKQQINANDVLKVDYGK